MQFLTMKIFSFSLFNITFQLNFTIVYSILNVPLRMLNYYSQYQIEIIIPLTPFPTALTISARALGALWWGSSWGGWWVISVAWLELKWTRAACLSRSLTPLSSDQIKSVHIIQPYTSDQKYLIFFKKWNLLIKEEWNNLLAKDDISIKWSNT